MMQQSFFPLPSSFVKIPFGAISSFGPGQALSFEGYHYQLAQAFCCGLNGAKNLSVSEWQEMMSFPCTDSWLVR